MAASCTLQDPFPTSRSSAIRAHLPCSAEAAVPNFSAPAPPHRRREFGVSARGVRLERVVEMYQYKERRHTKKRRNAGGGDTTVTTYTYPKVWSSSLIHSHSFQDPSFSNPDDMPFVEAVDTADDVQVGAYHLTREQVGMLGRGTALPLTPNTLELEGGGKRPRGRQGKSVSRRARREEVEEEDPYGAELPHEWDEEDPEEDAYDDAPPVARRRSSSRKKNRRPRGRQGAMAGQRDMVPAAPAARDLLVTGNYLYLGRNPSNPRVGDTRVSWQVVNPSAASLVGTQRSGTIVPFKSSNGYSVHLVSEGHLSAEAMFDGAHTENTFFTWLLRGGGWLLMFIGLRMVVEPAVVAPQLIPCVGGILSDILACGACLATCSTASVLALATIAVAWFFVRPTFSLGLLAVAAVVAIVARMLRSGDKATGRGAPGKVE